MRTKRLLAVFTAFVMSAAMFAACTPSDNQSGNGNGTQQGGQTGGETGNEGGNSGTTGEGGNTGEGGTTGGGQTGEGGSTVTPGGEGGSGTTEGGGTGEEGGGEQGGGQSGEEPGGETGGDSGNPGEEDKKPEDLPAQTTIYLVGDSTVCGFSDSYYIPRYGYGTQINEFFTSAVTVNNLALSGRSSLSFLNESNYTTLKNSISAGDYLIIGFGHNDQKTDIFTDPAKPHTDSSNAGQKGVSFQYNLYENYVKMAKDKGATPILCTPIVRLNEKDDYSGSSGHITADGDYAQAIRDLGKATDTTVIDLTALTKADYVELGFEQAQNYHAFTTRDKTGARAGLDKTHTNYYGAKMNAYRLASELTKTTNTLKWFLKDELVKPTYEADYAKGVDGDFPIPDYSAFNPEGYTDPWGIKAEGWYGTAFGDIGSNNPATASNFTVKDGEEPNSFVLGVTNNKGKIGSTEGITAVFMQIPSSKAFTITATATVDSWDSANQSQNGFGIMLRDDIHVNENDKTVLSNYVAAGVYGTSSALNAVYSRVNTKLTPSGNQTTIAQGSEHQLKIVKSNQTVTAYFDGFSQAYPDFDLVSVDSDYMYICLYVARNTTVTFTNVNYVDQGDAGQA